jgi:CubicO group peptidase (beta-lactamase class C family)
VPAWWVDSSFVPRTRSGWSGNEYGYGWWTRQLAGHAVRFAWGYGGQFIFIVPDLRITVVTTSDPEERSREGDHLDAIYDLVERYIIPAARGR